LSDFFEWLKPPRLESAWILLSDYERRVVRPKLLVFINQPPWNELILRGERDAKSGGNKINHVGLVLLYTSKSSPDRTGVEEFENPDEVKDIPRGVIVGACLFRCVDLGGGRDGYEYHLSDPRRFPQPVRVTRRGPVRFYGLEVSPAIERQLREVGLWRAALASDRNKLERGRR
jgi:hypothetical protein